jgi:hypothetical protein
MYNNTKPTSQTYSRTARLEDFLDDNINKNNKNNNKNNKNNINNDTDTISKNQQEFGHKKRIKP